MTLKDAVVSTLKPTEAARDRRALQPSFSTS